MKSTKQMQLLSDESDLEGRTEEEMILRNLANAYKTLIKNDLHLFKVDANERSLTHKYAEYLQLEFAEWNVDCEYNRKGDISKRIISSAQRNSPNDAKDLNAFTVYPDIIIHHRGTMENLVVIEAKKSNSNVGGKFDLNKLEDYKEQLKYRYAFMVKFLVGDQLENYEESKLRELIKEI